MRILFTAILAVLCFLNAPSVIADDALKEKISAAMQASDRPEADAERDRNRSPAETLEFLGLKDNMRVLELLPGQGWYTRILAPVLKDNGELYVSLGTRRVKEGLLTEPGFEAVKLLDLEVEFTRDGPFGTNNITPIKFDAKNLDMVLTFRNMHNFTPEGRALVNTAAFNVLKRGGFYGVVDHTQRHMEPMTGESRRRIDPVVVIKEVQDAGFELVNFSDLHYKPDDELRYEVGRKSVTGNTDRFTLLFRKP